MALFQPAPRRREEPGPSPRTARGARPATTTTTTRTSGRSSLGATSGPNLADRVRRPVTPPRAVSDKTAPATPPRTVTDRSLRVPDTMRRTPTTGSGSSRTSQASMDRTPSTPSVGANASSRFTDLRTPSQPDAQNSARSSATPPPASPRRSSMTSPPSARESVQNLGARSSRTSMTPPPAARESVQNLEELSEQVASVAGGMAMPRALQDTVLEWEEPPVQALDDADENIRVAARFRPLSPEEAQKGKSIVEYMQDGRQCSVTDPSRASSTDYYAFNAMFQPHVTQEEVYNNVAQPIVQSVIHGYNGAILMYGQTGSGKTHTMYGPDGKFTQETPADDCGIVPRALKALLKHAAMTRGRVSVRGSFIEIYNEHLIDLLASEAGGAAARTGYTMMQAQGGLTLPDIIDYPLDTMQDLIEVMELGNNNRHVAQTMMNRQSSRSHAVFIATVLNQVDPAKQTCAQLYLVDLAGSERIAKSGVQGTQLVEASNINRSLLSLGNVIYALAHKKPHVPYRDSKLTQLLRNCLGGNSKTAIVVTASPHGDQAGETISTMRFGSRASKIKNTAKLNMAENPAKLKSMLARAREDLNELRGYMRILNAKVRAYEDPTIMPSSPTGSSAASRTEDRGAVDHLRPLVGKRSVIMGLMPSLMCPLTQTFMRDPVIAMDGWTYDRHAIEKYFARAGHMLPLSPVSGRRFAARMLVPNNSVAQIIRQHIPDLPVPQFISVMRRLPIWLIFMLLNYLDAKSLARCEKAWSSFLAAADSCGVWTKRLAADFPQLPECKACKSLSCGAEEGAPGHVGKNARARYYLAAEEARGYKVQTGKGETRKGLHLMRHG